MPRYLNIPVSFKTSSPNNDKGVYAEVLEGKIPWSVRLLQVLLRQQNGLIFVSASAKG